MPFVDYYAVLNISRDATEQEVNEAFLDIVVGDATPDQLTLAIKARQVLSNWRERPIYDKTLGYPMVIQSERAPFPNAMCYQLLQPQDALNILLNIKEDFKNWVMKKAQLEWEEALQEHYNYELISDIDMPYLILRFTNERELTNFAKKLMDERKIKI